MKFILLGNASRIGVLEALEYLRPDIQRSGEIVLEDFTGTKDASQVEADLAIVFGGDGSILRAVNQMGTKQIPVLAVQLGTLNFLATVGAHYLPELLKRSDLLKLPVIEHLLLECSLYREKNKKPAASYLALNEVAVQGRTGSRLIGIELFADGDFVSEFRGDGLLLSTPVGSTAHNLSAGGPILRNDIDAVVLSPLSPHTLSIRPLVDSPDRKYKFRTMQKGVLIVDGSEITEMNPGDSVIVTRAKPVFKTVDVPGYCYYRILREKLGWNGNLFS
ncbi:NAD kinase [Planctomycetales bacterium]|nr:NAD kinase [Planctomycetales bacterium]